MVPTESEISTPSDPAVVAFRERRRSPRVASSGLLEASIALRTQADIQPVTVLDIGYFGMALVSAKPLAASLGERVFGVVSFYGTARHAPVRGALFRLTVCRRQPHVDGWLLGVEFADLRASPWTGLVDWIGRGGSEPPDRPGSIDWGLSWP